MSIVDLVTDTEMNRAPKTGIGCVWVQGPLSPEWASSMGTVAQALRGLDWDLRVQFFCYLGMAAAHPAGSPVASDSVNHAFVGNCSSVGSVPGSTTWHHNACRNIRHGGPPPVCGRCNDDHHGQPWLSEALAATDDVGAPVPRSPVPAGAARQFPEFWIGLRSVCEKLEQKNFGFKIRLQALISPPANAADMWNWPRKTCTCHKLIGNAGTGCAPGPPLATSPGPPAPAVPTNPSRRYCIQHQRDAFEDLVEEKRFNEKWSGNQSIVGWKASPCWCSHGSTSESRA